MGKGAKKKGRMRKCGKPLLWFSAGVPAFECIQKSGVHYLRQSIAEMDG